MIENLVSSFGSSDIHLPTALFGVLFSALLGFGISFLASRRGSSTQDLKSVLWTLPPIVHAVMLFVGSNLAMSIGLLGSLSIVRYRTAIRDPQDLAYLFWAIMVGLGASTGEFIFTVGASVMLAVILLLSQKLLGGVKPWVLAIAGNTSSREAVLELLKAHQVPLTLASSFEASDQGWSGLWPLGMSLRKQFLEQDLMAKVTEIPGVQSVRLIKAQNDF
ncbi:MAG: hypothetical protein CL677_01020 [Bdellovibrionaceae bacterium]|nr:hypothetical protein [Pseudobdellovibrionaceae bacterium]|tara:strand:+ start:125601 stop:126257 length:657 start_codon:yes stop_codon:yes gene_type:complete